MMMLLALIPTCLRWLLSPHLGFVTPGFTSGAGIDLQTPALATANLANERIPRPGLGRFALHHAPLSLSPPRFVRV